MNLGETNKSNRMVGPDGAPAYLARIGLGWNQEMAIKSRRNARTGLLGLLAVLLAFAVTPACASALITIEEPTATARTNPRPTFAGSTDDMLDVVDVLVSDSSGEAIRTIEATPNMGGAWSVRLTSPQAPLEAGPYTAVAEQTELLGIGPQQSSTPVPFTVDPEPPAVSLEQPATPSGNTSPSFSGTASEATEVVVHILQGTAEVARATTIASGGSFSTSGLDKALPTGRHTFTAFATEVSGIGNEQGKSGPVSFEVDTEPPVVTLSAPPTPSNDRTPSFSGTASEAGQIVIHIMEGAKQVATATSQAQGGGWTSGAASPALAMGHHTYHAFATETSSIGSEEGESTTVPFEVNTESPVVTLMGPPARSNNRTPTFSGTASEDTEVVVHVLEGGSEVAKVSTTASGGLWSTPALSKALPAGTHSFTAFASQRSSVGNPEGTSSTVDFEVSSQAPVVTLTGPPTPSNDTTPTFSGTASEDTEVVVHVLEGGSEVATSSTTASGGSWSLSLSKALPAGKHAFTAFATERSGIGNEGGESSTVAFVVNTEAPTVTLTAPPSPSNNTMPTLSGTASEAAEVVVHVFEGGSEIAKAKTTAAGGSWSATLSKALPSGKRSFTATATEKSALGNSEGKSSTVSFEVDSEAPDVTIVGPPSRSKNRTPSFSGTASEETEVVVHVFEGSSEVASVTTTAAGGRWSTSSLSKALPAGRHTFTAQAAEKSSLGNAEGKSATVGFEVDTEAPTVTLTAPKSPSNDTTPSFTGTASEATEVVVHVFEGGSEIASAATFASGGSWSVELAAPLPAGKRGYTAFATEKSGLANADGKSATVSFEVNTESPVVTMSQPPSRSNNTNPSFSGTASETTEVVVHVFEGSTELAKAKTIAAGGAWATSALSKALPAGRHSFTAFATEKSSVGNSEGISGPVTFEVDTEAPIVSLAQPVSPSNTTSPAFSGTASEGTEVVVHVFEGASEVASVATTASGGKWATGALSKALPAGRHSFTAFATEKSGLGNENGKSATVGFEVNTEAPTVTVVGPTSPSRNQTPSFSGTASEGTEVVVHVFEGASEVASVATTASGGKWATGALSKALPAGRHSFTAFATEKSGLGNENGKSATVGFEVDTLPPTVTIEAPALVSNNQSPAFSGTASEGTEVVVHVFEGASEVASVATTASGGKWATGALSKALPAGKHSFTAFATEKSGLGNENGKSATVGFEVDTLPPTVTIEAPALVSNNQSPAFSGTASEGTEVVVHVFEGASEVASVATTASGGKWATGALSKALPAGRHSFTAFATEKSGLGNENGKSATVGFEVNTEAPTVTVVGPTSPSRNQTPSFSGTASEGTEVVVHVFEGASEVASVATTASGGKWATGALSKALPAGRHSFTAFATEKSGLGNENGKSATVGFEVNTEAPTVTVVGPTSPSRNQTPSFSGTASEGTEVVVHVFEGASEVASVATTASGGKWATGALSKALPAGRHSFTAFATEKSGLGNENGKSATVGFEVDTLPPTVTIESPALVSNNQSPAFKGTAGEAGTVTVSVFEGAKETGKPLFTATSKVGVGGGEWSTTHVSPVLTNGVYTVVASEPSSLGNEAGHATATFEVNTAAPTVTLTPPPSPTSNRSPSFSGTVGSQAGETVTVLIYEGTSTSAKIIETAEAHVNGTSWETAPVAALAAGRHLYTAVATVPSAINGDPVGKSSPTTFLLSTEPPVVTLKQPPSPSNDAQPTFEGTTNESSEVILTIYRGSQQEGSAVATLSAVPKGENWTTTPTALPDGQYTAVARQQSAISNGAGSSAPVTFTIDTEPPTVTLQELPTPSANRMPSFAGTASDSREPVTVLVYSGTYTKPPPSGTAAIIEETAKAEEGKWVTPRIEKLEFGEYTVVARQKSSLGNGSGQSKVVTFVVAQIPPSVSTETPSQVTRSSAAIYASVNPLGSPVTSCRFEYGPSTAYGKTVECGFVSEATAAFPSAGIGFVPVFARIYGLKASTVYHVRIAAEGEGGTGTGTDATFTTLAPLAVEEPSKPLIIPQTGTKSGVASYFAAELKPSGKAAKIGALLKRGGLSEKFKAPKAGKVVVSWYYLPPGAKLAGAKKPEAVLVATGSVTFRAAGTATLRIRLSAAGRKRLRKAKKLRLTAKCVFSPPGEASSTTTGTFQITR